MKNCKLFVSLFTKGVQNVHHLHGHMSGDAFSLVNCSVDNVQSEIGPWAYLAQLQSFKPVKDDMQRFFTKLMQKSFVAAHCNINPSV